MRSAPAVLLAGLSLAAAGCTTPSPSTGGGGLGSPLVAGRPGAAEGADAEPPPTPRELARELGVELTPTGSVEVAADWKERAPVLYVFVAGRGDRGDFGEAVRALFEAARADELVAAGPPFGLFQRDPEGAGELFRACLPVAEKPARSRLASDVLPRATVAYAVVAGAYPDAVRARPGLEAWMATRGWIRNGPVREIYLVDPGRVRDLHRLACEVQIPWASAR